MAKIQNYFLIILLLFSCTNNSVQDVLLEKEQPVFKPDTAISEPIIEDTIVVIKVDTTTYNVVLDTITTKDTLFPSIQEAYNKYVGVREKSGKNDGPEVKYFLSTVGLPEGYAWCAAFVKACLLEAGVETAKVINGMALSCENKKNMVYKGSKFIKDPQPEDVFTLWYEKLGRIGHTGFFDKEVNSSIYETVEGNTNEAGSREGDGVYKKRRSYKATHSISRWKD